MAKPNENPEYISELKKLVNDKVISEMTAQIHLSDINKYSNLVPADTVQESQQPSQNSQEKFRNRRVVFSVLLFSAVVVIIFLVRSIKTLF
jgi:hypothetical protein